MSSTKRVLLEQVKVNDPQSWADFVDVYRPLITQTIIQRGVPQTDVQDVVQDVFTRLVREMRRFSYDRDRGRFRSWMRRVTTNAVFDWHRKRLKQSNSSCDLGGVPSAMEGGEHDPKREMMQAAINLVKPETRSLTWRCFELHLLQGLKAKDVARELGLTANAVYINSSRVLSRVREYCHQNTGES